MLQIGATDIFFGGTICRLSVWLTARMRRNWEMLENNQILLEQAQP